MLSKFDSVDSIVNYLREPTLASTVIDSSITGSHIINNDSKSSKKQQKQKDLINVVSTTPPPQLEGGIQISTKGRVR